MSDELTDTRAITAADVRHAVNLVVFQNGPDTVEQSEPVCAYPKVCGEKGCLFPRYSRNGAPAGLVARALIQLGFPLQLLLDLDREHELGEVLHPGVKIARSRNKALERIEAAGMALLVQVQRQQKLSISYGQICLLAFGHRWLPKFLDQKKRPWLY
jgi:hypothetical protein